MLKWFGLESNASQGEDPATATKKDDEKCNQSTDNRENTPTKAKTGTESPSNTSSVAGAYVMLSNFASAATKTAQKLRQNVDERLEKTIIGDFQRENEKFLKEKHSKRLEDPVPPWVGYNEETEMKSQILALSADERHFLRDPPSGVEYHFDLDSMMPVALTILSEDENLQKMRFNLVPKKVKEERFWKNYFYRVSLIKQSSQLSTLAQSETKRSGQDSKRNSRSDLEKHGSDTKKENTTQSSKTYDDQSGDGNQGKSTANEESSGAKDDPDTADWEKDLQDELQDFEFVSEDQGDSQEPNPEWEKEIEDMLGLDDDESETPKIA